jgi:aminodeoxyfutalosine deaminase
LYHFRTLDSNGAELTVPLCRYTIPPYFCGEDVIKPIGTVTERSAWVHSLPKIELHIHLEGAIRSDTVRSLSIERLGWTGELAAGWEHTYYTYSDFAGFMAQLTPRFPSRPDEYARIARECFEDLAALGVVYAEVSFDAPTREVGDDSRFWPIVEALEDERRAAESRLPIRVNWIVALMRTLPPEVALWRAQLAVQARDRGMAVVGIDLHGDEPNGAPAAFAPAYRLAEEHGLGLRAHAGEASGTESIWDSINILRATRIAHGIRATDDPALMERLKQGDITLEMCLTSNVRTASVPDLASHPFRLFYEQGIPVTINSDDPLPFFTDIEREYRLLVEEFGFTRDELRTITLQAVQAAFLPEEEKATLAALIDRGYAATETEALEAS